MNLEEFITQIEKLNGRPHDLHEFAIKNIQTLHNAQELIQELGLIMKRYACQPKLKPCKGKSCEHRNQ